jgi:hypothetical protein
LGGLLLGFSILFRPSLIIILLFIAPLNFNRKTKKFSFRLKQTILRFSGTIILLLISGLFFLFYPKMLTDFIDLNLAGKYTYTLEGEIEINPSFSMTRIILILLDILGLNILNFIVFALILLLFWIPMYFYYISSNHPTKLLYGFFIGIIIILIAYFDTWPHHLVVLAPFLILFIVLNKNFVHIKTVKTLHYLLGSAILGFWVLFYLTYTFFPFNIGGLLLLILLYYEVLLYLKNDLCEN